MAQKDSSLRLKASTVLDWNKESVNLVVNWCGGLNFFIAQCKFFCLFF